jgi:arsenate reductase
MLFLNYSKCSTCQRAKRVLDTKNIEYVSRDVTEERPTYEELKQWYEKSGLPIKKFFNTSGIVYRNLGLKEKLPTMSDDEALHLLATNGMLVKRPILVSDTVLVGFKADEWEKL